MTEGQGRPSSPKSPDLGNCKGHGLLIGDQPRKYYQERLKPGPRTVSCMRGKRAPRHNS
jgi:hypothetical protein